MISGVVATVLYSLVIFMYCTKMFSRAAAKHEIKRKCRTAYFECFCCLYSEYLKYLDFVLFRLGRGREQ